MILAFDTSGPACLAAIHDGSQILATRVDEMSRGQAEHLMPMLERLLDEQGLDWSNLTRIGVGVGPGNFTGIRISVSAARGLALGLEIPAVGVSTLDAIHHSHPNDLAAVRAPRDMLYVQAPGQSPKLVNAEDTTNPVFVASPEALIQSIAECAAKANKTTVTRPKPLYIKAADAAPSRDTAPVILS